MIFCVHKYLTNILNQTPNAAGYLIRTTLSANNMDSVTATTDINVNNMLKFAIGNFKEECAKIFDEHLENTMTKCRNEIYGKIESQLKRQIMENIGTFKLFDYSDIPEPLLSTGNQRYKDLNECFGRINQHGPHPDINKDKAKFLDFTPGEKLIFYREKFHEGGGGKSIVFLTNYARCFWAKWQSGFHTVSEYQYRHFDFWIPKDYIILMKIITNETQYSLHGSNGVITPFVYGENVVEFLKTIKERLYDRKIVPLYAREIVDENAELKAKYNKYEQDMAQLKLDRESLAAERERFRREIAPHVNLEMEQTALMAEKQKLAEERVMLRLAAQKIREERDKLEKMKALYENIDINNI